MYLASTVTVWKFVEVFSCKTIYFTKFTEVIICNGEIWSQIFGQFICQWFLHIYRVQYIFLNVGKKFNTDEKAAFFSLSFQDFFEMVHSGTLLIYCCTGTALSDLNIFHYSALPSSCPISLKVVWKYLKNVWNKHFVIWRNCDLYA